MRSSCNSSSSTLAPPTSSVCLSSESQLNDPPTDKHCDHHREDDVTPDDGRDDVTQEETNLPGQGGARLRFGHASHISHFPSLSPHICIHSLAPPTKLFTPAVPPSIPLVHTCGGPPPWMTPPPPAQFTITWPDGRRFIVRKPPMPMAKSGRSG